MLDDVLRVDNGCVITIITGIKDHFGSDSGRGSDIIGRRLIAEPRGAMSSSRLGASRCI